MRFKKKVVLVTGASKGLGRSTAILFAKEGADVVVNYYKSEKQAEEVVSEIKNMGRKSIKVKADVSIENEVKEMINQVITVFEKIDVLVNNAGVIFEMPLKNRTMEFWDKTLNVNLKGTFICSKLVSFFMRKAKSGNIINVASVNPIYKNNPEVIDYDVSKAGVIALTHDFSKELAPYVRVNAVAPGWIETDMNKELSSNYKKREIDKIYLRRFAAPEEIANVILFIASREASFVNNSIIKVDGGYN
ncbi:SDR family NAD(P)-dependent oxidoreductase [Tenacibaculum halocynthiae]|uniref:SDR family NAD(P)-dependent oxidoreductase n=1 Tax=Tenacibaculum halocynthiae TaxID=1254437 RepID=UPI003D645C71